jgi:hypothetical protein
MKAPVRLFANALHAGIAARLLACAGACVLTSGCVHYGLSDTTIDPQSPIAADAAKMARANQTFPKFAQIPPVPKDVRPVAAYGVAAAETTKTRDEIIRATEPNTWTLPGDQATDAFAGKARTAAGPEIAPSDPAVTEAFARELRRRATPPPPPKR